MVTLLDDYLAFFGFVLSFFVAYLFYSAVQDLFKMPT